MCKLELLHKIMVLSIICQPVQHVTYMHNISDAVCMRMHVSVCMRMCTCVCVCGEGRGALVPLLLGVPFLIFLRKATVIGWPGKQRLSIS